MSLCLVVTGCPAGVPAVLVASDGAYGFREHGDGAFHLRRANVPKYRLFGGYVVAVTGRQVLVDMIYNGVAAQLAAHPAATFADLVDYLADRLPAWNAETEARCRPLYPDSTVELGAAVVCAGVDGDRPRCVLWEGPAVREEVRCCAIGYTGAVQEAFAAIAAAIGRGADWSECADTMRAAVLRAGQRHDCVTGFFMDHIGGVV